jgi:hypothetical protein
MRGLLVDLGVPLLPWAWGRGVVSLLFVMGVAAALLYRHSYVLDP